MKKISVDFSRLPDPIEEREFRICDGVIKQLTPVGAPVHKSYTYRPYKEQNRKLSCTKPVVHIESQGKILCIGQPSASASYLPVAVASMDMPPPTCAAPSIGRNLEYRIAYDEEFKGGERVHNWFSRKPEENLMFCHAHDDYVADY